MSDRSGSNHHIGMVEMDKIVRGKICSAALNLGEGVSSLGIPLIIERINIAKTTRLTIIFLQIPTHENRCKYLSEIESYHQVLHYHLGRLLILPESHTYSFHDHLEL